MSRFSFPKAARLRTRRDYQRFRHDSKKFVGDALVIRYRHGPAPLARLGITIKKKFGKAHDRILFKRHAREAFRHLAAALAPGLELSIAPKTTLTTCSLHTIEDDFRKFLAHDSAHKETTPE